ncbi:glycosyltransferase [Vibrio breoganii]|uniref:glycosyltransferase n=1 Tax=Vibrio breoganii TaxID=553239 RepID=UPI0010BDD3AF|nr:glycosyltransferase [Vibrio breoganii]TKG24513.1 glycosyltransferase [Vibrio breoganii]
MSTCIYVMPDFDRHYFRMGGKDVLDFYNPNSVFSKVIIVSLSDRNCVRHIGGLKVIDIDSTDYNPFKCFLSKKILLDSVNFNFILESISSDSPVLIFQRFGGPVYHGLIATYLSEHFNCKLIVSIQSLYSKVRHGSYLKYRLKRNLEALIENYVYKKASRILLVSNYIKSEVKCKKLLAKSVVIPNKINDKLVNSNSEIVPYFIDKSNFYLSIGRLIPQKNYNRMIKAFAKYVNDGGIGEYHIIGSGVLKDDLECLIDDLGMSKRIFIYTDYLNFNQLKFIVNKSKALLFCSQLEGQGRVVYESLLLGCPVITSLDSPMEEMISDKVNGVIVNHKSVNAICDGIKFISENHLPKNVCIASGAKYLMTNVNEIEDKFLSSVIKKNSFNCK